MRAASKLFALPAALLALSAAASSQTVYTNAFTTMPGTEWSDRTISTSNGESFLASSANGFGNGTDTLTLSALPAHNAVTVSFDLYIINSWDGNGPAGGNSLANPDSFGLTQNGSSLLLTSFANFTGGNTQSYSAATPNGLGFSNAPRSGQFAANHLGFGDADYGDATYRFSYTFASSSSALALAFTSNQNQGVGDEGWGLDNVTVSVNPVPEPATFAALGLGALGMSRRRRR